MYKYQFGFRKGYLIEQVILEFIDIFKKVMDKKLVICGFFFDFFKVFDIVNYNILLFKFYYYGICGIFFKWFENYLSNRI